MTILVVALHVIVCLILILVILLQAGRGQGLSTSFGSGNVQSLFGTRASDFLTKTTSIAAICFLFTCIGLNFLELQKNRSLMERSRPKTPLDVDAIKKALEKVKTEAAQGPAKTVTPSPVPSEASAPKGQTAKPSSPSTPSPPKTAAADASASRATSAKT